MATDLLIKEGDVVKLKSGGPLMTANYFTSHGTWHCSWFVHGDDGNELREGNFSDNALKKS